MYTKCYVVIINTFIQFVTKSSINIFPITVPPLRERKEDIPLLIKAFVQEFSVSMGKTIDTIPDSSLDKLKLYDWPGNVRELRNLVERAMIISKDRVLHIQLPEPANLELYGIETLDESQRMHILKALKKTEGRIFGNRGAAMLLGINPRTLISRMKRLNIRHQSNFGLYLINI